MQKNVFHPENRVAKTAVYALTQHEAMTAQRLASAMDVALYIPPAVKTVCPLAHATTFDSLRQLVAKTFSIYRQHVFIAAAGMAGPLASRPLLQRDSTTTGRKAVRVTTRLSGQDRPQTP